MEITSALILFFIGGIISGGIGFILDVCKIGKPPNFWLLGACSALPSWFYLLYLVL